MNYIQNIQNTFKGCIYGLAVGDALGVTNEFLTREQWDNDFVYTKDIIGGGAFKLNAGEWTDDTSMMLCMANSIIERRGFDSFDIATKFFDWWQKGYMSHNGKCFDIGNTTRTALEHFGLTGEIGGIDSPANGSIMRIAPIPLAFYRSSDEELRRYAELSSKITHKSMEAIDGCILMSHIIRATLKGANKKHIFYMGDVFLADTMAHYYFNRDYSGFNESDLLNPKGNVHDTFRAALWAFHSTDNFKDGAIKVVNLCGDADTTGAVYGQIAGAYYGFDGIPTEWVDKIVKKEWLDHAWNGLYEFSRTNQ